MTSKGLSELRKPKLSYEEKKPPLMAIKNDAAKKRWTIQIRRNQKKIGDEKDNPIITANFQHSRFTKSYVENFLWWISEILYCQKNGYSFGSNHHQAIIMMREKSPSQFAKMIEKLDIDLIRANTMRKLFDFYLDEYQKRTQSKRDPDPTRKGNAPIERTTKARINACLKFLDAEMDPIQLTPKKMTKIFERLEQEKTKRTGEPLSFNTRKTLWSFLLTVFRRASLEQNRWIEFNPLENVTVETMPAYKRGIREFEQSKDQVKKLNEEQKEWFLEAMDDDPTIRFVCAYMLHKPTRLSEAKDMRWSDFKWSKDEECYFVNCKVDRKSVAVTYQNVALPYRMNKEIRQYRRWCQIKGQGADESRVLWTVSDEHLAYNRAIRDKIKHRIRKWNANNPEKNIPIYSAIMNTIRTNAFYYLLDLGVDLKSIADIGGTSVEQIQRAYCTDKEENIRRANASLLNALNERPEAPEFH